MPVNSIDRFARIERSRLAREAVRVNTTASEAIPSGAPASKSIQKKLPHGTLTKDFGYTRFKRIGEAIVSGLLGKPYTQTL